jgi:YD repeat-containing protein
MSTGLHTLYSCEYSADGKLIKEFDSEFGEYEYIYDGNGNVVDKRKIDGGVDMTKYEREVSFDASGRIVSETRTYGNGAKERFEYKYGANGKVAEETFTNFYGEKSRYKYTYDSKGELIGILEQFDGLLLFSATCTLKLIYCNVDMPEATEKYFSLRYLASSVHVDADAQPSGTTAPPHPGSASNPAEDPEWDETVSPETYPSWDYPEYIYPVTETSSYYPSW